MSLLLILFLCLGGCQSFVHPTRWTARSSVKLNVHKDVLTKTLHDEICIGDLPSIVSVANVVDLLHGRGVDNYVNVSVSSYGTSEGDQYGSVRFDSEIAAQEALAKLPSLLFRDRLLDVSMMPNVSTIYAQWDGNSNLSDNVFIKLLLHDENVDKFKYFDRKNEVKQWCVYCKSPQHARRFMQMLRNIGVRRDLAPPRASTINIVIYNLDPSITTDGLKAVLNELIGATNYKSAHVAVSRLGKSLCRGVVHFHSEEKMKSALEILESCKIMDKPLAITTSDVDGNNGYIVMYLGNIDPQTSMADVEALCRVAVGKDISVRRAFQVLGRDTGERLPYCLVYFASLADRDLCIQKLNDRVWNKRRLVALSSAAPRSKWALYVSQLPVTVSQAETEKHLLGAVGDTPVKRCKVGMNTADAKKCYAHLTFYTEDHMMEAKTKLEDLALSGVKLRVKIA